MPPQNCTTLPPPMPKSIEQKYQARLQAARDTTHLVANTGISVATRNPTAGMVWAYEDDSMVQEIIGRYGMKLIGLPADVPFMAPGYISSIKTLEKIINGFVDGTIYFESVYTGRITRFEYKHGVRGLMARARRSDEGNARDLRPFDTRSHHLRKGTKNKTKKFVSAEDELRAERAIAEMRAAWVSYEAEGRDAEPEDEIEDADAPWSDVEEDVEEIEDADTW